MLASGHYEWRPAEGGKQPYFISVADSTVLSIAGLGMSDETRKLVRRFCCTLIVTGANEFTRGIHDRMPVFLEHCDHDA